MGPLAAKAVGFMVVRTNRPAIDARLPTNGWGMFTDALTFLVRIERGCIDHPKATFRISC